MWERDAAAFHGKIYGVGCLRKYEANHELKVSKPGSVTKGSTFVFSTHTFLINNVT